MDIASLREKIRRMEGRQATLAADAQQREARWCFGMPEVDRLLPDDCLATGSLHDVTPEGAVNVPSVSAFACFLLCRLPRHGPVVWCLTAQDGHEFGRPYGPGFLCDGLDPGRLVFVLLDKAHSMAFALEEALKMPQLAAVLGQGLPLGFTQSRRLSLIAGKSGVPCLFINTRDTGQASAAVTRWKVGPAPALPRAHDDRAPGRPAWSLELARSRGGKPGSWKVYWNDDTHSFAPLPEPGSGTLRPRRFATPVAGPAAADRTASRIAG